MKERAETDYAPFTWTTVTQSERDPLRLRRRSARERQERGRGVSELVLSWENDAENRCCVESGVEPLAAGGCGPGGGGAW
jgi:hypothetical protein